MSRRRKGHSVNEIWADVEHLELYGFTGSWIVRLPFHTEHKFLCFSAADYRVFLLPLEGNSSLYEKIAKASCSACVAQDQVESL